MPAGKRARSTGITQRTCNFLLAALFHASCSWTVPLHDVEPGIEVGHVEPSIRLYVDIDLVQLLLDIGPRVHHANRIRRHEVADLPLPEWISDVIHPQARVLVGGENGFG